MTMGTIGDLRNPQPFRPAHTHNDGTVHYHHIDHPGHDHRVPPEPAFEDTEYFDMARRHKDTGEVVHRDHLKNWAEQGMISTLEWGQSTINYEFERQGLTVKPGPYKG